MLLRCETIQIWRLTPKGVGLMYLRHVILDCCSVIGDRVGYNGGSELEKVVRQVTQYTMLLLINALKTADIKSIC